MRTRCVALGPGGGGVADVAFAAVHECICGPVGLRNGRSCPPPPVTPEAPVRASNGGHAVEPKAEGVFARPRFAGNFFPMASPPQKALFLPVQGPGVCGVTLASPKGYVCGGRGCSGLALKPPPAREGTG